MNNDFDLSWFDLEKYDGQAEFSSTDWFTQLRLRDCIKAFGKKHPDLTKKYVDLIKENPLIKVKNHEGFNSPVRDASYIDLLIANDRNPKVRQFYNLSAEEIDEIGGSAIAPNINNECATHKPILAIDLGASDEQLMLAFKRWIHEQRVNSSFKPKMLTLRDYEKWTKRKVLPYLDLTLIASFEDKKLAQHTIGGLLFPNDINVDITERIRKVVKPLADSLLEDQTLSALRVQSSNHE